jgi:hypothetical protein
MFEDGFDSSPHTMSSGFSNVWGLGYSRRGAAFTTLHRSTARKTPGWFTADFALATRSGVNVRAPPIPLSNMTKLSFVLHFLFIQL